MMQQITVLLENREGHMAQMCRAIADAGVNMSALTIADTTEYGVARIIADKPAEAKAALEAAGYSARISNVLAVAVPNKPSGLADLLDVLEKNAIAIDYGYCFSLKGERAIDVLKVAEPIKASAIIAGAGFELVDQETFC